jgi:4-hydroxythreonine-4-phosphate dehydrogenase
VPVKLIAPRAAANVTLGLPYVRTSPDHGTAFDIAGTGAADAGGMETSMRWAIVLSHALRGNREAGG